MISSLRSYVSYSVNPQLIIHSEAVISVVWSHFNLQGAFLSVLLCVTCDLISTVACVLRLLSIISSGSIVTLTSAAWGLSCPWSWLPSWPVSALSLRGPAVPFEHQSGSSTWRHRHVCIYGLLLASKYLLYRLTGLERLQKIIVF